jgi:hypothetical protein
MMTYANGGSTFDCLFSRLSLSGLICITRNRTGRSPQYLINNNIRFRFIVRVRPSRSPFIVDKVQLYARIQALLICCQGLVRRTILLFPESNRV